MQGEDSERLRRVREKRDVVCRTSFADLGQHYTRSVEVPKFSVTITNTLSMVTLNSSLEAQFIL